MSAWQVSMQEAKMRGVGERSWQGNSQCSTTVEKQPGVSSSAPLTAIPIRGKRRMAPRGDSSQNAVANAMAQEFIILSCFFPTALSQPFGLLYSCCRRKREVILWPRPGDQEKPFSTSQQQVWAECLRKRYRYDQSRQIPLHSGEQGKERKAPRHTHPF